MRGIGLGLRDKVRVGESVNVYMSISVNARKIVTASASARVIVRV